MTVRINEPPSTIDLLNTEKAGRLGLGVFVAPVSTVSELSRPQRFLFLTPLLLQIIQTLNPPRTHRRNPLAELVHDWLQIKNIGSRIFGCQRDGTPAGGGSAA